MTQDRPPFFRVEPPIIKAESPRLNAESTRLQDEPPKCTRIGFQSFRLAVKGSSWPPRLEVEPCNLPV
jgi:predicted Zn-ribbon and HTH transcriptional regulator